MKLGYQFTSALILLTALLQTACGGSESTGGEDPFIDGPVLPGKAVGTLPVNGEPCVDYQPVAGSDTRVEVSFQWNSALNADSYLLIVLDGLSEVFRSSYTTRQASVELDRGKTYSWSVVAVNTDGQTLGDTYSFTTPGIPEGNFAPYAAEISMDFNTVDGTLSVTWTGSDPDGDPITFDVRVLEDGLILAEEFDLSTGALTPLPFKGRTAYTVEVYSRDNKGSFSVSVREETAPDL